MKKFFMSLFIISLISITLTYLTKYNEYSKYGEANLSERVSQKFIEKNVKGNAVDYKFNETENLETGSANMVTSIVVNYRAFDTLGEITVLFISALGISLLLGALKLEVDFMKNKNFILSEGMKVIIGLILLVGIYIFVHGHLTPGGGFQGGSIIAAGILLLYMSEPDILLDLKILKAIEGLSGSIIILVGILGSILGGFFLYNFLPSGVMGTLYSSGIIPVVYILVGLKVGAELASIISSFLHKEVK